MPSPLPRRIVFLDPDHVVRLGRNLLAWETEDERRAVHDFFLPETIPMDDLAQVGHALRAAHGPKVSAVAELGALAEAEVLMFRRGTIDADLMERCPRLRLIQRIGASSHTIDLNQARARGIFVSCLPRPTLVHVSEHVMMLLLTLSRQFREADRRLRVGGEAGPAGGVAYNWADLDQISSLFGKVLGIVGYGEIGQLVAQRAHAFGMRILCADNQPVDPAMLRDAKVEQVPLPEVLDRSDVVSVHVPPQPDGRPLIGPAELAAMKPGAFLINTSRGVLIDEDALYAALVGGRIAGAALDVHLHEPRGAEDRFLTLPNVVLTPHVAGGSRTGVLDEMATIFANIDDVLQGRPPRHARVA